ncbi:hypothetical protein Tco_1182517 [Tanacetum coccineum]
MEGDQAFTLCNVSWSLKEELHTLLHSKCFAQQIRTRGWHGAATSRWCYDDDDDGVGVVVSVAVARVVVVTVGWWRVEERVRESEYDEWVDPGMELVFGVGRKIPPEKYSGGGAVVTAAGDGGGRRPVKWEREMFHVYLVSSLVRIEMDLS